MGNGGRRDDFVKNGNDFESVLRNYYAPRNYKLVLNGDIEDLYKFNYKTIYKRWSSLIELFNSFEQANRLFRIQGNHDFNLDKVQHHTNSIFKVLPALRLKYKEDNIFIFHGHQTSNFLEHYNVFSQFFVRYYSKCFFINNFTVPHDSMKKFKTEVRAYDFSTNKEIISILGHTHRALFESLSKKDSLMLKIENLIARYSKSDPEKQSIIEKYIKRFKDELQHIHKENKEHNLRSGIYDKRILVPCLFNSGSAIGKRGFNGIEINRGKISLIYWFDKNKSERYLDYKGVKLKNIDGTDYYRAKLNQESLDYLFTRIKLLCQ